MAFEPDLERELRQSVRQARMMALTCLFVAPVMYTICLGSQVLRSHWELFLAGFSQMPWDDPQARSAIAVASLALFLALILPPRLGRPRDPRSALGVLKGRNLLTCALMVVLAVSGLYLGVKIGPPAASLSLAMFLVTMLGGWSVFPSEAHWRSVMALAGRF
jgi:hypothetical protein